MGPLGTRIDHDIILDIVPRGAKVLEDRKSVV